MFLLLNRLKTAVSARHALQDTETEIPAPGSQADFSGNTWQKIQKWLDKRGARSHFHIRQSWLVITGLLAGVITMTGLLSYSGDRPVNALYIMAVFGPLQWLMMLMAVWAMISGRSGSRFSAWLSGLNWLPFMPAGLYRPLLFWLNQLLALSFSCGALLAYIVILATQDIAFGWSTTLDLGAAHITPLFSWLSLPWQWLWPDASVSQELLNATRFFRLQGLRGVSDPALFGHWWPFLLAFVLCYSILPRTVLLIAGSVILGRRINALPEADPDLRKLLASFEAPSMETGHDVQDTSLIPAAAPVAATASEGEQTSGPVFSWGLAEPDFERLGLERRHLGIEPLIGQAEPGVLLVPGWEPPLGELADRLGALPEHSVAICLMPLPGGLNAADIESWQLFAEKCSAVSHVSPWDVPSAAGDSHE